MLLEAVAAYFFRSPLPPNGRLAREAKASLRSSVSGKRGVTCPIKSLNPLSISQHLTMPCTISSSYSCLETNALVSTLSE